MGFMQSAHCSAPMVAMPPFLPDGDGLAPGLFLLHADATRPRAASSASTRTNLLRFTVSPLCGSVRISQGSQSTAPLVTRAVGAVNRRAKEGRGFATKGVGVRPL